MLITPEERLREFVTAVRELERNRFFPACLSGILNYGLAIENDRSSVTLAITHLDTDALKSFLVTFRRFTMDKETCSLVKVYDAALKTLRGSRAERLIRLSQARVQHAKNLGKPMTASIGGISKPIGFFKLWVYAHPAMFHRQENARERLIWDRVSARPNHEEIITAMALQFIRKVTRELVHLKRLIEPHLPN
jgi:hypothetical protein